jgi:methylase of polypeptide subunit release factors
LASEEIETFEEFVKRAKEANTHPAKLLILSDMLKSVFGVQIQDLVPGIEKKLGSRVLGVRGSADLIFSNVIFELKIDLKREEEDAKKQIPKYFQALREKFPGMKYIAIATDCTVFKAYVSVWKDNVISGFEEISSLDISKSTPSESILWLDSFIFSKPKIRPSAEDLKWRFGPASPTYWIAIKTLKDLWDKVRHEPDIKLKLDIWKRNLEIVYGKAPHEQSFIDHTYLVTLVKLIIYLRLSADNTPAEERIKQAISGEYFSSYGITNLIEEELFSWPLQASISKEAVDVARQLISELLRYDFSQIDEDFFKEIYQDVIERGQRHRIGEYYTPEWLTELTLNEAISTWTGLKNKELRNEPREHLPAILDAFSGSGTFLSSAIRYMKKALERQKTTKSEALRIILTKVVGIDINPLAVTIARANYLIALGDLLTAAGKGITIPNYVSDSLKIPKVETIWEYKTNERVEVYDFEVSSVRIQIPTRVARHRSLFGTVLDAFREGIKVYNERRKDQSNNKDAAVRVLEKNAMAILSLGELGVFKQTFETILSLIDKSQDSIWIYVINNMYAPVALMESKFDILVSNPPWIAMRYIESKSYQDFLKNQVIQYRLLETDQVKLFTHMEAATLCFCKSSDLYLNNNGVISFVMPRSVITAAFQHKNFQNFKVPPMKLEKVLDFEDVIPLFKVPSCVLIASKNGETYFPVFARRYKGKLSSKNLKLEAVNSLIVVTDYNYEPQKSIGKGESPYHDKVRQGATIVPRSLWFVDFEVQKLLGSVNKLRPKVRSAVEIAEESKEPWKGIQLEGNVEAEFVYCTILGGDIVPFGFVKLWPVVLPIEPTSSAYSLLDIEGLKE